MAKDLFNREDIYEIEKHGLSIDEVNRQLDLFHKGVSFTRLVAPCTAERGVLLLDETERNRLASLAVEILNSGEITKFVPASGAATRMFRPFLALYNSEEPLRRQSVNLPENRKKSGFPELVTFMDNIEKFALYDDLARAMKKDGLNCMELVDLGRYRPVLKYLLTKAGLGYAALPKGMIKFHKYIRANGKARSCTAFEEHLAEAAACITGADNTCRVHFTVPAAHRETISDHVRNVCHIFRDTLGTMIDVTLSTQAQSTDTLAVDSGNRPFRDKNNRLVFRPGGHGSLLGNLGNLDADIVFIKNVDNIATKPVREKVAQEIHALFGMLVETRQRIFSYIAALESGSGNEPLEEVLKFTSDILNLTPPERIRNADSRSKRAYLLSILNRPLRVCGVVKALAEPGGGPFFVQGTDGTISPQIVEAAQVDMSSENQKKIWKSSTHFNPVMIVCSLRDARGNRFDLEKFVDSNAYIITEKSFEGRPLRALEHPGLWNGSMAFWNTVFVEIPTLAFNPVKTVLDLLRPGHLPVMEE